LGAYRVSITFYNAKKSFSKEPFYHTDDRQWDKIFGIWGKFST